MVVALCILASLVYYFSGVHALLSNPEKLFHKFLDVTKIGALTIYSLLLNLGVFVIISLIEIGFVGWGKSSVYRLFTKRSKSMATDLWCWTLSVFGIYRTFSLMLSFGLFYMIVSLMYKYIGEFELNTLFGNDQIRFLFVFILSDFKIYIWHYFMHRNAFWELHKLHHSATEFNIITNSRVHFIESAIGMVFHAAAFLLLGVPPVYYLFMVYIKDIHANLLHSNVRHSFGWVGRYLIISPNGHHIHHSKDPRHHNKNFGAFFTWWDHLFSTFYISSEPIEIGIDDEEYNKKGFWYDTMNGAKHFLIRLIPGTRKD